MFLVFFTRVFLFLFFVEKKTNEKKKSKERVKNKDFVFVVFLVFFTRVFLFLFFVEKKTNEKKKSKERVKNKDNLFFAMLCGVFDFVKNKDKVKNTNTKNTTKLLVFYDLFLLLFT